jgi:TonB-dependent receptor
VVVTGYRASLQSSIAAKKNADSIVDVIKAEDIGKFPDNNLSESMQRIPGVAIDRDAGEGRTMTVRGLGGLFTRTKLNDMEALATTGGRDSSGGANRDRGFDYNVFAAELFSSIKVSPRPPAPRAKKARSAPPST